MDPWFEAITTGTVLPHDAAAALSKDGFCIIPGPRLDRAHTAYDRVMAEASPEDTAIGGATTRVHDFVNRGPEFDALYTHPPLLAASGQLIGQPFKLSSLLGRTLRPHTPAQKPHVDFPGDASGWPMLGFIFAIDDFRADNGATRFAPGSQGSPHAPPGPWTPACADAGSLIVFNGSIWHGHGANVTDHPRRSIQGAFIRRGERSWTDFPSRMRPETAARIGPLAKYLLSL